MTWEYEGGARKCWWSDNGEMAETRKEFRNCNLVHREYHSAAIFNFFSSIFFGSVFETIFQKFFLEILFLICFDIFGKGGFKLGTSAVASQRVRSWAVRRIFSQQNVMPLLICNFYLQCTWSDVRLNSLKGSLYSKLFMFLTVLWKKQDFLRTLNNNLLLWRGEHNGIPKTHGGIIR